MKAVINKELNRFELDNEAVKAIRFVKGWNTDLRVHLDINRSSLFDWIEQNGTGIFGVEFIDVMADPASEQWTRYANMIWNVVDQIVR